MYPPPLRFDWAYEHYKRNISLLVGNSGELLWDRRIQVECVANVLLMCC